MISRLLLLALLLAAAPARADDYHPADEGQHPRGNVRVLPEQFLRGYDPITVYYGGDEAPTRGPADEGSKKLKIAPEWPGAWFWADRRTLQFRPAEPWPALARFSVEADSTHNILTTMMSAPSSMAPSPDSDNLTPFRTITLTFPQALPLDSLKQMIKIEVRDLPGLADSPRHAITDWSMTQLPRGTHRDAAVYAITLKDDVPEGKQLRVDVSLALGDEGRTLWTGRVSTRMPFHLDSVQCGAATFSVTAGGSAPRDMALACGNHGELPQLVFSAPVQGLTLSMLTKLIRLEPAVADLDFNTYGARVELRGHFVPDTLYKLRIAAAPIQDDAGRELKNPGEPEVYFYRGWKQPFLRFSNSTALLEANGPRMVPLTGYGDPRADVRIYRIDPNFNGLWPFPDRPVVVDEEAPPPFPGEEPANPDQPNTSALKEHLRLLGSPLISKIVDLPLGQKSGSTKFGLDLAPLLDPIVGEHRAGTYLIGLRRLTGKPERTYMRVQITNLTVTAVAAHDELVFYVRTLDKAEPVRGARIVIEGHLKRRVQSAVEDRTAKDEIVPTKVELTTDADGKAAQSVLKDWTSFERVTVASGEDLLTLNPHEPPPLFSNSHWGTSTQWLDWLKQPVPKPVNDKTLAFLFTERPIYRPGESVFLKGWIRNKSTGKLGSPGSASEFGMKIEGPGGQTWSLPISFTPLAGLAGEFKEKDLPTGDYHAILFRQKPYEELTRRPFKIEAYRIPTFELQLAGAPTVRLDGPFKVKAVARYYAGGNVADAPIAWTVTRRPYRYVPKNRPGFLFADSTQFSRQSQSSTGGTFTKAGTLDQSGAHEITVNPALDVDGSARIYHFEATVTGPDEQQVTSVQETKALPPFTLGLKLDRYLEHATEIAPQIIAVGVDDKLLAKQDVTVRFYRRIWHSILRETHFATGDAKYVTEQEDVKLLETEIKTAADSVSPKLPIKESGVYVVELSARDKLGRVQTLSADLYVGGRGAISWQKSREGVFELSADQPKYKPGETARIIIQSPFQTGRALVVVEEPEGNKYFWHEVTGGKAVHELKVRAEHVPNVPVHVVLMRGRIGEGGTEDGRYRPQTLASTIDVEVTPAKNLVDVGLKFPETARPGSTTNVTLTLADDTGKPLAGEVTLWLVDEAVLSLAKEQTLDPLTQFIVRNSAAVSIWDTRNMVVGRIMEQDEDPGGDGDEGEGKGKRVIRKDFRTVPYYEATLQVPASGKLVVPIKLSDDLTNFRVRAVAASGWSRFGMKQDTLRVRLPLLVQPQLPRFVREGDRFWAGGVARLLEGAEGPGSVDISLTGPVDGAAAPKSVDLKSNKAISAVFPLTARTTNTGEESTIAVKVGVTRKSDGEGDAFEVKVPVLPDVLIERSAYITRLKPNATTPLKPLPEPARPGTVNQRVMVTAVPGVLDLAASLDYLITYPHGCLEQRVSQVTPELSQGALLHAFGLDEGYGPRAMSGAKKVLTDLKAHQDEQGLFAYWPGSAGDIQLTAEVVEFMSAARKAGLPVDETIDQRARSALERVLRSDYNGFYDGYRWNQQVVALRALGMVGKLDEHYLISLFEERSRLDTFSIAELAMAMSPQADRFKQNLDALKKQLWGTLDFKLVHGVEQLANVAAYRDAWGGYYLGSNTSTLSAVFEALLMLDPADKRHALIRDALIEKASANTGWGSTYEDRIAIEALAKYLELAHDPLPSAKVTVGSKELTLDISHRVASQTFPTGDALAANVSGGEVGARVSVSYLPDTPGTNIAAQKQGFIVSRSSTLVHADGTMDTVAEDHHGETRKFAPGDVVELHATLVNDEEKFFAALIVPFAAGFEPLNPELETSGEIAKPSQADSEKPTYVQRLDSEVRYYFNRLPKGTHTFHFRVRATTEGSFVHPAPWAELMYRQDVRGRGEGMRVVVSGANEK